MLDGLPSQLEDAASTSHALGSGFHSATSRSASAICVSAAPNNGHSEAHAGLLLVTRSRPFPSVCSWPVHSKKNIADQSSAEQS